MDRKAASIDKIQLQKRHDLAEEMAVVLHQDYDHRVYLRRLYAQNLAHLPMSEAIAGFDRHETMFMAAKQVIGELPAEIGKLQHLNRQGSIYFNPKTTRCIDAYIENTKFTYTSLGDIIGPLDYSQKFFENLLNEQEFTALTHLYNEAVKKLRRATR